MPYHYDPNQPRIPAGHHDGGEWTREGHGEQSSLQHVFYGPNEARRKAIEAFLAWFAWLSTRNSYDQQAIISFNARRYDRSESAANSTSMT
jgi:hypothetical protein